MTLTEQSWLQASNPDLVLEHLRGNTSDRKLRLFAVACCRRLAALLDDGRLRRAVEVVEGYADGLMAEADLAQVHAEYNNADHYESEPVAFHVQITALFLTWHGALEANRDPSIRKRPAVVAAENAMVCANNAVAERAAQSDDKSAGRATCSHESAAQAALLRDIFGDPFHPITLFPALLAWNDGTVVKLAMATYDDRQLPEGTLDNGRLAILADALEEAGCTDAEILGHLRGPGPHVRGCWPVDLCLGKA